jgi:hypothetical protein
LFPSLIGFEESTKKAVSFYGMTDESPLFFQKSKIENSAVPLWLVNKKEKEVLAELRKSGHDAPEQFQISGLRAGKAKSQDLPSPEWTEKKEPSFSPSE